MTGIVDQEIRHDGIAPPYWTFDRLRRVDQAAIVDNKHLRAALTAAREIQALRVPGKRNDDAPTRRAQAAHMFPEPAADPVLLPARSEDRLLAAFKLDAAMRAAAAARPPRGSLPSISPSITVGLSPRTRGD